jgi:hypothetical protein
MIITDKKKTASLILSKMGTNGSEKSQSIKPEEEMNDSDGALKAIAEDMLQAFSDKSAHDLMESMKAFIAELDLQSAE